MANKIYTGVVGLPIRLVLVDDGVVHNPTSATVREITLIRPDGTKLVKNQASGVTVGVTTTALPDAPAGSPCLQYITLAGEIAQAGGWSAVGYLEDAAGKWEAEAVTWRVHASRR